MALESQGTTFEIETGTGDPVTTVTATVGYPTIITKATHGLSNGDVVALSAFAGASAALMNDKTVVVKNVTTNTLAVDINTTGGTLTAANGTLTPQAFTAIGEVIDWSMNEGEASEIDRTHLLSTTEEIFLGIARGATLDLGINFDHDDAGYQAARTSKNARTLKSYRVTYSSGTTATFDGYCKAVDNSGGVDGKVDGSIMVKVNSIPVIA
jgi:hypothetical protein